MSMHCCSTSSLSLTSTLVASPRPSLMTPLALPYEVWMNVARWLPPLELGDLIGVNSALYNIAMDCKYGQISFSYLSTRMLQRLERLRVLHRDPHIARRVRVLHVHPHFIKELIASDNAQHLLDFPSNESLLDTISKVNIHTPRYATMTDPHKHGKRLFQRPKTPLPPPRTLQSVVELIDEVLKGLINLQEYRIAWVGLPAMPVPFMSTPFVTSPLTRFTLDITLENLQSMFALRKKCMVRLTEMDIFLRTEHRLDEVSYNLILSTGLAALISSHPLEKLTLRLFEPIDLSPLLCSIRRLSHLRTLSLTFPLTAPYLGDTDALADFLNLHSHTLETIHMRANDLSSPIAQIVDSDRFTGWITDAFSVVRIEALHSLDLGMGLIPYASARLCLLRFSRQLERLTLTGRALWSEEVQGLLEGLNVLKRLRLGPITLSPEMIYVLSESAVERLELIVTDVRPSERDAPIRSLMKVGQDECQLERFVQTMGNCIYPSWRLASLELVLQTSSGILPDEIRPVWLRSVPQLKSIAFC
ncbi:hypothetical protein CYLTODRAFT_446644 [Cylindrobasidium torrendii FP15055 ss-10]|uniref:Uncharacterized protein n=1 Tax=Cylindrobasidium torrendii FP15055 ss-10 TaxID=1314674 RepID=A0A0D7AZP7_9AGAR|nr:hypothetical protein CYLTODRAFT_446644 [Cylindrobasidium torrendii FP15055 ss-10]